MAATIRVGLAFADSLTREGRRMLLQTQADFDVVYEESDGTRMLQSLADAFVDVVLVDSRLKGLSGFEVISKYLRRNSGSDTKPPAFILTGPFSSDALVLEGVRCGATGVVTEEDDAEVLLQTLRASVKLDSAFNLNQLVNFFEQQGVAYGGNQRWRLRLAGLDAEEERVLEAIAAGLDGEELKSSTGLPATKIRWTLDSLQRRLGLATRSQLALALYEAGLTKAVG